MQEPTRLFDLLEWRKALHPERPVFKYKEDGQWKEHYIDEYIEPYHQEDILDYFANAESDSVEDALSALGEDEYSMEEIRIMKIKFMSDLGN